MAAVSRSVLCLMGPTASGKTELAIALARRHPVRLISVDSAMVYRGMDIGTAKPDAQTLGQFPHELVDITAPQQSYSAALFVADAERCIEAAFDAGELPVLVGGTMLYFKALLEGLADLPESSPALRERLRARAEAEVEGIVAMHRQLAAVDPVAAQRIDPNNTQRVLRALEVYECSGKPISVFWREQASRGLATRMSCQPRSLALLPPRALLHQRIERRFEHMLDAGLLAEVEVLRNQDGVHRELPAMRAVGYRQALEHLAGETSRSEMIARATAATRQLAKRQCTWLRSWPDVATIDPLDREPMSAVLQYLQAVAIVA